MINTVVEVYLILNNSWYKRDIKKLQTLFFFQFFAHIKWMSLKVQPNKILIWHFPRSPDLVKPPWDHFWGIRSSGKASISLIVRPNPSIFGQEIKQKLFKNWCSALFRLPRENLNFSNTVNNSPTHIPLRWRIWAWRLCKERVKIARRHCTYITLCFSNV